MNSCVCSQAARAARARADCLAHDFAHCARAENVAAARFLEVARVGRTCYVLHEIPLLQRRSLVLVVTHRPPTVVRGGQVVVGLVAVLQPLVCLVTIVRCLAQERRASVLQPVGSNSERVGAVAAVPRSWEHNIEHTVDSVEHGAWIAFSLPGHPRTHLVPLTLVVIVP